MKVTHSTYKNWLDTLERNPDAFEEIALQVFQFQYQHNNVYRAFCDLTHARPSKISRLENIPHLPIAFFKNHSVSSVSEINQPAVTFRSSGTTGQQTSQHHLWDTRFYDTSLQRGFQRFLGSAEDWVILALLPGYLERSDASLVYMVRALIAANKEGLGGFYLNEYHALHEAVERHLAAGKKVLLWGVTHALLSFVESMGKQQWPQVHIMETGGMKGKRREMIREELHELLQANYGTQNIYSEYGMTEMLSQAYYKKETAFVSPPWLRVHFKELRDPRASCAIGKSGLANVTDLSNIESCAFIATEDLGKALPNGNFEILGRMDHAELRGCNLMV